MTNAPTTRPSTTAGSPPTGDGGAVDQAKAEVRSVADKGKQTASHVADEARSQAAELARTARDEAHNRADGEVRRMAGYLSDVGDELAGIANGSPPQDGHLQGLARDGARAANRLSQRLETDGLDGALHDVSMFARRRPVVFLAAAFGVGIALGRVTRNVDMHSISEEMHRGDDDMQRGNGDDSRTSTMPSAQIGSSPHAAPSAATTAPHLGTSTPGLGQRP